MLSHAMRSARQTASALRAASRLAVARRAVHTGKPAAAQALKSNGANVQSAYPNDQLRMLLIGAPGAGKGTQSGRLQRDYGVVAMSSGDLLRKHVRQRTPIGRQASGYLASGKLMPDTVMAGLMLTELSQIQETAVAAAADRRRASSSVPDWLLDGYPRNVVQAESLDQALAGHGSPLNLVVSLEVPDEVILKRILSRWVHAPSGRVYNLHYNPPQRPGRDDVTGEPLTQRPDDNEPVFRARMEAFYETTVPLLEHYDRQGVLVSLKGDTSDAIYAQLQKVLAGKNRLLTLSAMMFEAEEDMEAAAAEPENNQAPSMEASVSRRS